MVLLALSRLASAQTNEGIKVPTEPPQVQPGQIEANKLSKVPKQTKFVEAEYPRAAAEQGIEANVVLLLYIDAQGKVTAVGVSEPASPPGLGFDEAAMVAAHAVRVRARRDGRQADRGADLLPLPVHAQAQGTAARHQPAAAPGAPPGGRSARRRRAHRWSTSRASCANAAPDCRWPVSWSPCSGNRARARARLPDRSASRPAPTPPVGSSSSIWQPGEWKVLIEPPGYYPFRTTETISANEAVDVTYYVERGSYNPFDVTVTATRPRKEVSRTVISAKEIEKVPGAMGDPLAVVQNFAGVARMPIAGLLIVRGSAPEDSKVFVDGVEVPLIYHFGGLRSVIPVGMLQNIEFYPGNFSPMYGRATGGIVDVQIKKLEPPKVGGYADVSLLDTGVYLEAPLGKKGAIALAGRRSYIDFLINAAVPDDAPVNLVTAPRYYDYQLLGNYRPAPAHDLRAFFFGSDDRLRAAVQEPGRRRSDDLGRLVLGLDHLLPLALHLPLRARRPAGKHPAAVAGSRLVQGPFRSAVHRRQHLHQPDPRHRAATSSPNRCPSPPGSTSCSPGPISSSSCRCRPRRASRPRWASTSARSGAVKVSPGPLAAGRLRRARLASSGRPAAAARPARRLPGHDRPDHRPAAFHRALAARTSFTVKGGAGLFVQEPNINEGETDEIFGNPDLRAERARHYSFGFELKALPQLTFDVTGFYKQLRRLVSRTDDLIEEDGMPRPLIYDNRGQGRVYGLELVARHEFANNFTGWVAYTLSRALRTDSGETQERLFDFDQTHILTAVASYLLPRNWQVGGRFRLVSGNPRTPVVGQVFNASFDRYDPMYGAVNSDRNAPFHQLDLRVDKRWIYQGWMLSLYLDIQNVYNRANPEGLQYNFDFRESRPQQGLPLRHHPRHASGVLMRLHHRSRRWFAIRFVSGSSSRRCWRPCCPFRRLHPRSCSSRRARGRDTIWRWGCSRGRVAPGKTGTAWAPGAARPSACASVSSSPGASGWACRSASGPARRASRPAPRSGWGWRATSSSPATSPRTPGWDWGCSR